MGLGDTIARWTSAAKKTTQQLTLDTACYVAWHGLPYYMALSDMVDDHPLLADIWRGASKIFTQDVVPMVVAQSFNQGVQSGLQEYNNPYAETFKMGVQVATSAVVLTRAIEGSFRTLVLTVETGRTLAVLTNDNTQRYKQLCEDCSAVRFIQGSVRDLLAFWAIKQAISYIQWLPVVGSPAAEIGNWWIDGGYVGATIMPICDRHLDINKEQDPAFYMAIGLHHALMTALVSYLIQLLTRLPGNLYRDYWDPESSFNTETQAGNYLVLVSQLCLVVEMMLAANIKWPEPVSKATRYPYNPFLAFKRLVGFPFDSLAKGLKKTVPPLIRAANSDRAVWVENKVKDGWNHPMWSDPHLAPLKEVLSWLSWVVLPEIFYHEGGFKDSMIGPRGSFANDSVIGPSWNRWREEAIAGITVLEERRRDSILLKVLGWSVTNPATKINQSKFDYWKDKFTAIAKLTVKETAIFFARLANHPEARELGVPLLKAINNDFILRMLGYLRAGLEDRELPDLPECLVDEDFPALRDPTDSAAVVERREVPDLPVYPSSEDFAALREPTQTTAGIRETFAGLRQEAARQRRLNDASLLLGRLVVEAESSVPYSNPQGCSITEIIEDDEAVKASSAPAKQEVMVAEPVETKSALQSVNSQTAREVISIKSPSVEIEQTVGGPTVVNKSSPLSVNAQMTVQPVESKSQPPSVTSKASSAPVNLTTEKPPVVSEALPATVNSRTVRELTVPSRPPAQSVNSVNARSVLSLSSPSKERRKADRQLLLGQNPSSLFSRSEFVQSALEQEQLEQAALEAGIAQAMGDRVGNDSTRWAASQ